jgi:hypothetical protein
MTIFQKGHHIKQECALSVHLSKKWTCVQSVQHPFFTFLVSPKWTELSVKETLKFFFY